MFFEPGACQMSYTVGEIAKALGAEAAGDLSLKIDKPNEPATAGPNDLALAMEPAFAEALASGSARAAILYPGADWQGFGLEAAIFAPRSRYVMAGVSVVFERALKIAPGIHPSAVIEPGATLGENPSIGPFVHICADVKIGNNARIASHCSIGEGTIIGDDVMLHPGVRLGPFIEIGARFIAQSGAAIGGDGFSFVTPKPGAVEEARDTGKISEASKTTGFVRINSLGSVLIADDVEVGANSTIDRGTISNTTIGRGTKIDNGVVIGHNVKLGQFCLLCGQSGIAGSATVGDRVILGGQSGISDHLKVGADVILAGQTGVTSNVPPNRIMMGSPAMRMALNVESYKALRRLPRLMPRLQKLVSKGDANG